MPQGPPQPITPAGPLIEVGNGLVAVAVVRAYGPRPSATVIWSGRVGFFISAARTPLLEMEVSLMASKDGREPWVSLPSREYQKDGQRTYQRTVYLADEAYLAAIQQAIAAFQHSEVPF